MEPYTTTSHHIASLPTQWSNHPSSTAARIHSNGNDGQLFHYSHHHHELTKNEFKLAIQNSLRQNGIVDDITAHVRRHLITSWSSSHHHNVAALGQESAGNHNHDCVPSLPSLVHRRRKTSPMSLKERAFLSMMIHYFEEEDMIHTIAVFIPEAGLDVTPLPIDEYRRILGLQHVDEWLASRMIKEDNGNVSNEVGEKSSEDSPSPQVPRPILRQLIDEVAKIVSINVSQCSAAASTQTEENFIKKQLDEQYQQALQIAKDELAAELEANTRRVHDECDAKMKYEIQEKMELFERSRIETVRLEGQVKHGQQLAEMNGTLLSEYNSRLQKVLDKEEKSRQIIDSQRQDMEKEHARALQEFQQETEKLRQIHEGERQIQGVRLKKADEQEQRLTLMIQAADHKVEELTTNKAALQAKLDRIKCRLQSRDSSCSQAECPEMLVSQVMASFQTEIVTLKSQLSSKSQDVNIFTTKWSSAEAQGRQYQEVIARIKNEHDNKTAAYKEKSDTETQRLQDKNECLAKDLQDATNTHTQEIAFLQRQCAKLEQQLFQSRSEIKQAQETTRKAHLSEERAKVEVIDLQSLLRQAQDALSTIQTPELNLDTMMSPTLAGKK